MFGRIYIGTYLVLVAIVFEFQQDIYPGNRVFTFLHEFEEIMGESGERI